MAGLSRRRTGVLLAFCLVAGRARAAVVDATRWWPWPAARPTPVLCLPDLQDQSWDLAQEQGHPVLLNFWASWCEPCRAEMQSFEALQNQFKASGLKVVAVNFKEGREPVQRFRAAHAPTLSYVRDSYGEAARAWGVHSFRLHLSSTPQARPHFVSRASWTGAAPRFSSDCRGFSKAF